MTQPHEHEHDFYARDSAHGLAPMRWPEGKPLALAFVVNAEYYDLYPSSGAFTPGNVPGGFGRGPYPDYRAFSMREYGNRVGVFRLMDMFDRHGLKASLAVDANVAQRCVPVVRAALDRDWDLVGHGISVTEVISEQLSQDQERDYIARSLTPLRALARREIAGWHGPEYAQSSRTLPLLAEQGIRYMLDWPHDERPVPMRANKGSVLSLPMSVDLDDVMAHWHRKISMARWLQSVLDAIERLTTDGQSGGRLLVLNLHSWLMGQPYRTTYLDELLSRITRDPDIWFTTTDAIARHAAPR